MSYQEIRSMSSSFTTVLIIVLYYLYILNNYSNECHSVNIDFSFWGKIIVLLIPILIAAQVIVQIVLHIVLAILTRGREDISIEDERDKLIDLKATRNFYHVFMAGFFIGVGTLALGFSPVLMFNIFLATILLAGMIGGISQFFYYRRGV